MECQVFDCRIVSDYHMSRLRLALSKPPVITNVFRRPRCSVPKGVIAWLDHVSESLVWWEPRKKIYEK